MDKIEKMTAAQVARMPEWVEKWTAIGLSTDPANFDAAEKAGRECYSVSNLPAPKAVIHCASPLSATIAGITLQTHIGVRRGVWQDVGRDVRQGVWQSVEHGVRRNVEHGVGRDVRQGVWQGVEHGVGHGVRHDVGQGVWQGVRQSVEHGVGRDVWQSVEQIVGRDVWRNVEQSVGHGIWLGVQQSVGQGVRQGVRHLWTEYRGGQFWASWAAYATFFRDVLEFRHDCLKILALDETLISTAGWLWWGRDVLAISDRPEIIRRDQAGRMHSETGPAIRYRDGWSIYSWRGIQIPPEKAGFIENRSLLTPDIIDGEENAELRRIKLEAFGFERYIAERGARVIAEDTNHGQPRRLLEMNVRGEPIRVLDVYNGSLEPDGTRRRFFLGAMRNAKTPHEAVAMSYGIRPENYNEQMRT